MNMILTTNFFNAFCKKKIKIKIKESKKYIDKNSYEKVILKMNNMYMSNNQEEIIIPVI